MAKLWDGMALAGAALFLWGLWLIWTPLPLTVGGAALIALAVWGASRWK